MHIRYQVAMLICLILMIVATSVSAATDIAGSRDYPLIGRFEGSVITSYEERDFGEHTVATGVGKSRALTKSLDVEGRKFRISYKLPTEQSIAEVFRNFELRLKNKGFNTLFKCEAKKCGQTDFRYAIETIPSPKMQIDAFKYRYVAAEKSEGDKKIYATILVSINNKKVFTQVIVVEAGKLDDRMINAKQMQESISETGRIALYGIYFDFDKAVVKPESQPTLEQINALLSASPKLRVLIVGHTDSKGSLKYNRDLSQRRAQAVVKALIKQYKINPSRLVPAGVGYLAPVASNKTEEGRAKNRRVELVEF